MPEIKLIFKPVQFNIYSSNQQEQLIKIFTCRNGFRVCLIWIIFLVKLIMTKKIREMQESNFFALLDGTECHVFYNP